MTNHHVGLYIKNVIILMEKMVMKQVIDMNGVEMWSTKLFIEKHDICYATVKRWEERGLMPKSVRIGRTYYYPRLEAEELLRRGESTHPLCKSVRGEEK